MGDDVPVSLDLSNYEQVGGGTDPRPPARSQMAVERLIARREVHLREKTQEGRQPARRVPGHGSGPSLLRPGPRPVGRAHRRTRAGDRVGPARVPAFRADRNSVYRGPPCCWWRSRGTRSRRTSAGTSSPPRRRSPSRPASSRPVAHGVDAGWLPPGGVVCPAARPLVGPMTRLRASSEGEAALVGRGCRAEEGVAHQGVGVVLAEWAVGDQEPVVAGPPQLVHEDVRVHVVA